MNRREGFKALNAKILTEAWFELWTEASISSSKLVVKNDWIFLDLSVRENGDKTQLTSSSFSDPL